MALLSVIRRWHLREGVSIREIARRTKLSRNTIRKYLANGTLQPVYPKRKSPSKLDPYSAMLASWLERESTRGRKQRRNWRQLFDDLVALGYRGSYDRVAAFARAWERQRDEHARTGRGTFVPLVFAPGEAFQFDWSEDWAVVGSERTKLAVAQFKLCHSRAFVLRAYPQQTHEMLFDAHNHAFAVFGGIPKRGIYDNMKTAVDEIGRGKARTVNARFRAMTGHFLLALLLTIAGHSPIVATGFDEAQHALLGAERMPDVIICDQLLARIQSGFKTIERIRGLATHPIPAIVLTDCVTWSATREKRGRIEDCYKLNKPFDGDKLLAFIASTLDSATRKHLALISQDDCVLLESKLRSKVTG